MSALFYGELTVAVVAWLLVARDGALQLLVEFAATAVAATEVLLFAGGPLPDSLRAYMQQAMP